MNGNLLLDSSVIIPHLHKKKGTPIPDNDIWIAASARRYGLSLGHRDQHFELVPKLKTLFW